MHTGDDARRAIDVGADAIVVSNHGGRQLDTVAPTLRVLPEVVAAANGRIEVLLDSGIRRGSDVAKAMCMGARAVLVGRAYAYGLRRGGGARRRAGDRDPAKRSRPDAEAARLRIGGGARRLVRRRPHGMDARGSPLRGSKDLRQRREALTRPRREEDRASDERRKAAQQLLARRAGDDGRRHENRDDRDDGTKRHDEGRGFTWTAPACGESRRAKAKRRRARARVGHEPRQRADDGELRERSAQRQARARPPT